VQKPLDVLGLVYDLKQRSQAKGDLRGSSNAATHVPKNSDRKRDGGWALTLSYSTAC